MSDRLDDVKKQISTSKEIMKALRRQEKALERAAQERSREISRQRHIIVGEMVVKYFPEINELKPSTAKHGDHTEFEILGHFLSALADDKNTVAKYKALAQQRMMAKPQNDTDKPGNQPL